MELRATFDSFDFKILANVILKNHRNSDFHWITHYLTFDRISIAGLDDTKPLVNDISTFSNSNYLLKFVKDELHLFRKEFIVLVSRVLVDFFPCLSSLESFIPISILSIDSLQKWQRNLLSSTYQLFPTIIQSIVMLCSILKCYRSYSLKCMLLMREVTQKKYHS